MSEDNKTRFGNMPLGMINKMLVSFIGEDAFLDYCEKHHKDWELDNWQSREAFKKHLDRLFEEKESSYRDLNPNYEQSVYGIACKILDDFCKQYDLPLYIADTILDFYDLLFLQLSRAEYPVWGTHYMLDHVICGILHIFVDVTVYEIRKNHDVRFSYLDAETKYNIVFDELGKKFTSLEKFYTKLSNWYAGNNNKKNVFSDHFKKIIINNCKKGQNPAKWKDMKAILDFCKKEEKTREMPCLIEAYLTANVQNFIEAELPEENWNEIKEYYSKDIVDYVTNNYFIVTTPSYELHCISSDELHNRVEKLHYLLLNPIDSALSEIFVKHVYLQNEKKAEYLILNTENDFYCNWLHAYIAVAKGEFENAKKLYSEAFKDIRFAGIWTEPFLKQAFALSVYCDANPDAVHNTIEPEKPSKAPIPGKKFWEYGHAIGIFDKPAEDAFLEYVYRKDNFSAEFPQEMFFPDIEVNPDRIESFFIENIKEKIEEEYNRLSVLKEGSINKRLRIFDTDDGQRRPPLSMAIWLFDISSDEKFLDLIERWLGLSDPKTAITKLNFNAIADLGETPLNAATMAYKNFCAKNNEQESSIKTRLKKITTYIFGKTKKDRLGIATKRKGIHALQNVIDSCDIDLIKELVKGGLDIDSIRLTPDRVSPVYYTIGRIFRLQDPKRAAITMLLTPENTNWEYADVPGMTAEDKKKNYYKTMNKITSRMREIIAEYVIKDDLGDESTYMEQIKNLKEICLYLIDQTENQDAYQFINNLRTAWTSLTLATETDDVDICRALLDHGADPNISLETWYGDEIPNTFLHRCIRNEAWKVLEMFLTEFKDKAAETIKKYNNSEYEPLAFFKAKNKEKRAGFIEKFIKLFESCGADSTINQTDGLKKSTITL